LIGRGTCKIMKTYIKALYPLYPLAIMIITKLANVRVTIIISSKINWMIKDLSLIKTNCKESSSLEMFVIFMKGALRLLSYVCDCSNLLIFIIDTYFATNLLIFCINYNIILFLLYWLLMAVDGHILWYYVTIRCWWTWEY
jgi:hypothetical protein